MRYSLWTLVMIGCAEPIDVPSDGITTEQAPEVDPGATPGGPQTPPTDGAAGFGEVNMGNAPPTMGTFAGDLPQAEVTPKFTQEELVDAATIKGVINCTGCTGNILIRVLPPPPMDQDLTPTADGMQLITQSTISEPGEFAIKVPDKSPYVMQVVDDVNKDGSPSQGERMGMSQDGPVYVDGTLEGVTLTVGVFPDKEPTGGLGAIPTPPAPGEEGIQVGPGEGPPGAEGVPTPPAEGGAPLEGSVPLDGEAPVDGPAPAPIEDEAEQPSAPIPVEDGGPPADDE